MKLKKFWHCENGSITVIAAIAFTLIVAICGLVIDVGSAYIQESTTQNTADAAAYAAGTMLPAAFDDDIKIQQVKTTAINYVVKNGFEVQCVESVELEDVYDGKYYGVRVKLKKEVSYDFGAIFGVSNTTVKKSAKVCLEPVTSSTAVAPLGIESGRLTQVLAENQGQHLVIKYGAGDGTQGSFGALDLDGMQGGGAQDFENWLAFGYSGVLHTGDILPVESGNMATPTYQAFMTRFNQCTHYIGSGGCNTEHFEADCPRVITLIVYDIVDSKNIKVIGFTSFVLEGMNENGEIIASKVSFQAYEGDTGGSIGGVNDYGVYRARLVE